MSHYLAGLHRPGEGCILQQWAQLGPGILADLLLWSSTAQGAKRKPASFSLTRIGTFTPEPLLLGSGSHCKDTTFSVWKLAPFRQLEHAINLFVHLRFLKQTSLVQKMWRHRGVDNEGVMG